MKRSVISLCSLLVGLSAFLWSASASRGSMPEAWGPMAQIEEGARQEGQLVIYSAGGHTNREVQRAMSHRLQERYGIRIDWTTISAQGIGSRVLAEQRTRRNVVDLLMHGVGGSFLEIQQRGYLRPMLAPSTLERGVWRLDPARARPKNRDWLYIKMPLSPSFLVNTRLVSPGEEPQSYQDLLDPRWKGKIVLQTPGRGGSGSGWFQAVYKSLGLDYMRQLAKQVVLVNAVNDVPDSVARGQFPVAVAATPNRGQRLIEEGAPVRFVKPKEGGHMSNQGMDFIANAPHANAAKLFVHWFYTREGQALYAKHTRSISLRKDVAQDYMPPYMRYLEGEPFMVADPADFTANRARELLILGKEIFEQGK